jgi:hypothetical protein
VMEGLSFGPYSWYYSDCGLIFSDEEISSSSYTMTHIFVVVFSTCTPSISNYAYQRS